VVPGVPMDEESFDKFAGDYDRLLAQALPAGAADTRYFAEHKVLLMARQLRGRRVATVLDFGCGPGRSLPLLGRYFAGAKICGFDPSESCLAAARERFPGATLYGRLDEVPAGGFDGVLLANVLHHVSPPARAETLRRVARLLAPGGSVFIVEHNPLNPLTRRVFERCPFDADAVMLPRREVRALGQAAGLKLAAAGYTLFFPPALRVFRRCEALLAWLPLGAQHYTRFEK
jgi:SAM-dependent methyltransferase